MTEPDTDGDSDEQGNESGLGRLLTGDDGQPAGEAQDDARAADDAETGREGRHTVEVALDTDQIGVFDVIRHRGGDETAVVLSGFAGGYQAFAIDVDAGGQFLAIEQIGSAEGSTRAASMCEFWLDQHPKGVLGGDDGGGLLDALGFGGGSDP